MNEQKTGRRYEITMDIAAPIERVWKAISDGEELMRWFPPEARSMPGPDGSIFYSWGPEFSSECKIHVWEPPNHLRVEWIEHPPKADPVAQANEQPIRLAVDYELSGRGGTTTLRLVHSGFGGSRAWDGVYDDISRGWPVELRSLRHYLERHPGKNRQIAWVRAPIGEIDQAEAWKRLTGPNGLSGLGGAPTKEGARYSAKAPGGDVFEGEVVTHSPPREFSGTVRNVHDSLLRLAVESCFGQPEAWVWLSAWGAPPAEVRSFEGRMKAMLTALFPTPARAAASA